MGLFDKNYNHLDEASRRQMEIIDLRTAVEKIDSDLRGSQDYIAKTSNDCVARFAILKKEISELKEKLNRPKETFVDKIKKLLGK